MALVAYDDSGESSNDEEDNDNVPNESVVSGSTNKTGGPRQHSDFEDLCDSTSNVVSSKLTTKTYVGDAERITSSNITQNTHGNIVDSDEENNWDNVGSQTRKTASTSRFGSLLQKLPSPKVKHVSDSDANEISPSDSQSQSNVPDAGTSSLFSLLPPPIKSSESEEQIPEIESTDSAVSSAGPSSSSLTKPSPKDVIRSELYSSLGLTSNQVVKEKGMIKIGVPSLKDFEDENEVPPAKKRKVPPAIPGTSSGLMSMLPAPKQVTKKEMLIPQSVKKKAEESAAKAKSMFLKNKPKGEPSSSVSSSLSGLSQYENDEDSNDGNANEEEPHSSGFFFLNGPEVKDVTPVDLPSEFCDSSSSMQTAEPDVSDSGVSNSAVESNNDEPLNFDANWAAQNQQDAANPDWQYPQASYSGYYEVPEGSASEGNETSQMDDPVSSSGVPSDFRTDEAFLRLQGKRNRGEDFNLIDISQADQTKDIDLMLTKQLSEEAPSASTKVRAPGNSLARKRHQITYLAFQAKQRELELKNEWAQNRMTRRQTQAKYGF